MAELLHVPGIKIKEERFGGPPIVGVGTSIAGFVGVAPKTPDDTFKDQPRLVTSADQFIKDYCGNDVNDKSISSTDLSRAVLGFFANGGAACYVVHISKADPKPDDYKSSLDLFKTIDDITIIAVPGQANAKVYQALTEQATLLGDRFAILDPPAGKKTLTDLVKPIDPNNSTAGWRPAASKYAAFYYPRILVGPQLGGDKSDPAVTLVPVTPVGHIAGIYARVDATRGVFKAPANEVIQGALDVEHRLTDADQDQLNNYGINVLRNFSGSIVVWGARTAQASEDEGVFDSDYLYINVRRLVNYIEESLKVGLRWAVFEPNTLALRQQISRSVRGFLDGVWRDGGLFGATADEAYQVRFPDIDNTDTDRALGRLTVEIRLRVTYPAEFIIIRIGLILQSATTA